MQFCAVEQHKRPRQIQLILLQRPLLLRIAGIVRVTSLTFRHWQLGRRQASLYLREHGLLLPSLDSIQDADPKSRAVSFSIHARVDDDASNDKVVLSRDADKERNDRAHQLDCFHLQSLWGQCAEQNQQKGTPPAAGCCAHEQFILNSMLTY